MKTTFTHAATVLCAAASFFVLSCEKPEIHEDKKSPTVGIETVSSTPNSVTFTLKAENASIVDYKVDIVEGTVSMTEITADELSAAGAISVDGLKSETEYVISAIAYNEDRTEASETASQTFTTGVREPFMTIDAVTTTQGIFLSGRVDSEKYPKYFIRIFDPKWPEVDPTENYATFKVDSKEQFIRYLKTNPIFPVNVKDASFSEWNKTMLSSKSDKFYIYAVPVESDLSSELPKYVCKDFDAIIECVLTKPEQDKVGQGEAAVTISIAETESTSVTINLTGKQGDPVAYYVGCAKKSEVTGTLQDYVQTLVDGGSTAYDIDDKYKDTYKLDRLEPETEYYAFSYAYGTDGRIGQVQSAEFTTLQDTGIKFNPELTITVTAKSASFTSAVFGITRNGVKNGYYNTVTKADFESKYNSSINDYAIRELINKESGWPRSIYNDNDVTISALEYNTEYVIIVLPSNKVDGVEEYGTPCMIEFATLKYEATGTSTVKISIDKITDDWGIKMFTPHVTLEVSDNCQGFYYVLLTEDIHDAATNLGETVAKETSLEYRSVEDGLSFTCIAYTENSYLVVIPVDKDGKCGSPVSSELLTPEVKPAS